MLPRRLNYDNFRHRQVDTLKIFNDNVCEVRENEEYSIQFKSSAHIFHLNVILGKNFPNEKPKIKISPLVQHQWVNCNGTDIDNAPGLLNYSRHSDLGRIVQAIIRQFEKFPPRLLTKNDESSNESAVSIKDVSSIDNSSTSFTKEFDFPNLKILSLDELKKLDSDPEFFDDFIEEMSVVKHLNEELDSMINQVENISKENESKDSHLSELKVKLKDDVTALKNLGKKCDELNLKYVKKSEEFAPQHIRELLQIAASNSDADCEKHVENFLNSKIDVQTFLNNYTCSKNISSQRKAKEERFGHQLSALEKAGIVLK